MNKIIDEDSAVERIGDKEFFYELVDEFIQGSSKQISDIEEGIETNNIDQLKRTIHTLKGTSANLSLTSINKTCLNFEQIIKKNELSKFFEFFENLKKDFEDLELFVNEKKQEDFSSI